MVNRRTSREEEDMAEATINETSRGKGPNRKGSKTSDYSDNKKDTHRSNSNNKTNGRKYVDGEENLKKRDAPASRDRRKRSQSSDDSDDSKDRRKPKNSRKDDKNGRFDSSDDESDRKGSNDASDKDSESDKKDNKRFTPEQRSEPFNKRSKPYGDNVEYEIYFGDISFDARENDIRDYFGNCGNITQVKLLTRDDGKSRGRGFIKFSDEKSMKNALKLNGTEMMGRRIVVEIPANASTKRQNDQSNRNGGQESSSIIVRNLPFNLDEEELGDIFRSCGSIKKFRIIKNESGVSKGFGFVDFETPEEAKNALSKNGIEISGRNVTVDFSIPKDNRGPSGFNRGFGGRGDRGGRGRRDFGGDRPSRGFRRYD